MSGLESALSKSIREALTASGAIVTRVQSGILPVKYAATGKTHFVHAAPKGTPDMLIEFELIPIAGIGPLWDYGWGEVKAPGKKLSTDQRRWHAKAIEQGRNVGVWRSIREALRDLEIWRKL